MTRSADDAPLDRAYPDQSECATIILRNSSITLARHMIGVLRDATTTVNDGDNELINREWNSNRKDNPSKPRSTQLQGKRKKLVTTSAVRDDVATKEDATTLPTFAPTVDKEVHVAGNAPASMEKEVDSYGSGTRRKTFVSCEQKLRIRIEAI